MMNWKRSVADVLDVESINMNGLKRFRARENDGVPCLRITQVIAVVGSRRSDGIAKQAR